MAEIPLRLIGWVYDEETNRVEAKFEDVPLSDDPDPVNFRPTRLLTIELLPQAVDSEVRVLMQPVEVPLPPIPEPSPEAPAPTPVEEAPGGTEEAPSP